MLNKKDPLISAVQKIMQNNQSERDAVRLVNEKFGVTDRKALPHNRQAEWDAAYKSVLSEGAQSLNEKVEMTKKQFANLDGDPKFTANDLHHARKGTHVKKAAAGKLEEDETSPSSMGIKKPDYAPAGTTPEYAKPTTQTVNRAEKTSMPAGTVKESVMKKVMQKLEEKKLTSAEKSKREEIASAMEKKNPGMPMSKKMAIATAAAKKAAE